MGSQVDVTKGKIILTSISKPGAPLETAEFYDGIFTVTQVGDVTNLTLSGPLAACPKKGHAAAAAKKPKTRRLWGSGKGNFRTTGKYSRRDHPRHHLARPGLVRGHAHPGQARRRLGARQRQAQDDRRQGAAQVHGQAEALEDVLDVGLPDLPGLGEEPDRLPIGLLLVFEHVLDVGAGGCRRPGAASSAPGWPPPSMTSSRKLIRTDFGRLSSQRVCGSRVARRDRPRHEVRPGEHGAAAGRENERVGHAGKGRLRGMTEFFGACPLDCPDGCNWVVTVEDGQAVKLRGNRDHPYTAGALCAKVNGYLDHTRAADRLLYPLRRVGAKGEGRFERISWDEASAEIAERLHGVIDEYGGEAIWPFQGTGSLGYVQGLEGRAGQRLWNVLGASRHEMTACSVAGRIGASYVTGTAAGMDPETFTESKLILLWGTNPLTSGHHVWKFMHAAQKNGAHVVAIDPLRTRTVERADEHIAPLPGSDSALALGLLWVILDRGAEDREYIARNTVGFEAFRERILEFPPDRVAALTGLREEQIVSLGRARSRPRARPPSAARRACSATPAAAPRCARCTRCRA